LRQTVHFGVDAPRVNGRQSGNWRITSGLLVIQEFL